jgi:hypothetical protein
VSIRDTIRASEDGTSETVDVPEWGVKLEVRSTTVDERATLLAMQMELDEGDTAAKLAGFYPAVLVATCFDPDTGEQVFNRDDVAWLVTKNSAPVEKVAQVALRVCGMAGDTTEEDLGKD